MKILVIGSGGREHALVWKLRQSSSVEKIWCTPGNGGIAKDAECVPLDIRDIRAAGDLAENLGADLTVVGPELPLVIGIADEFKRRGLKILGPTREASQLEGSKVFAKKFLEKHGIPTAPVYGIYDSAVDAYAALCAVDWPLVIKADGLCAGKGVLVTSSPDVATSFIDRVMDQREFGDAGKHILLEEGLAGEELSYIILTDGRNHVPLVPTRDHKRAFDNDEGPNTGGMGAYSADGMITAELEEKIQGQIVRPTLQALQGAAIPYQGFLYFGLMLTTDGPKVLEFNCRLGDPEAEAILLRADFDLAEACLAAASGQLENVRTKWTSGASMCVVVASEGYPINPQVGRPIHGLGTVQGSPGLVIFHAGTREEDGQYYTSGGRVLEIAARGKDLDAVRSVCYDIARTIEIEGSFYRTDIGENAHSKAASEHS